MQRGLLRGDASKIIETQIVGVVDREKDSICKMSFSDNELQVSHPIFTKSYISFESNDTPNDNSYAMMWSNQKGEINIRKPNELPLNLFDISRPLGYSIHNDEIHDTQTILPNQGQGSIQFKKNKYEFGASSQFQYNYGTNTLLVSKLAPYDTNASMNIQIYNSLGTQLNNVMTFTNSTDYNTEHECLFQNVTINISNAPIRNCTFIGFDGTGNNNYEKSIGDGRGCIYTSGIGTNQNYPFNNDGNIIIQPNYENGSIVFPTASEQDNWKNTVIIKDKHVSINPSRTTHSTFIEFDAQSNTRRMNIHGQEGDSGIWSLVHTNEKNLEFQYFENEEALNQTPSQTLTMRRITSENAFSYNNKHLCEIEDSIDMFHTFLQNSTIFVFHENNSFSFSNNSANYSPGPYNVSNRELFFSAHHQSLAFYVPHSPSFQSVSNMIYENSHWIASHSQFSFYSNLSYLDISNNTQNVQQNYITYTSRDAYTTYANSFSGFLASATGFFKNRTNDNDINLINIDDANPMVTKTSTFQDPSVVGVIGRIEREDTYIDRSFYWGGFGTTLYDRSYPRVVISSTGFVGAWVVVSEIIDNQQTTYSYEIGDFLTSHSCGALTKQSDSIKYNYTIAKLLIDSVADPEAYLQTENTSQFVTEDEIVLELKGVMLLL